jgi:hypothetical protein
MIKRYHDAKINCVLELFAPPSEFEKWVQSLNDIEYKIVVLLPSVDEAVSRNADRPLSMKESKIRENHEWFTKWKPSEALIIDSTSQTIPETVAEINHYLN